MSNYIKFLKQLCTIVFIGIISLFILNWHDARVNANSTSEDIITIKNNLDKVPFFFVVGIVGGCITLTLIYVSWRKYQNEKKKQSKEEPNS